MTIDNREHDVTDLLVRWRQGDKAALDALIPVVYRELRGIARARVRAEPVGHSLQPTALVHEVYLRLISLESLTVENRAHFFAVAARLMRQILVDHARRQKAGKRGAGATMIALDEASPTVLPTAIDVLALDQALEDLASLEQRLCRVVELKFFAGLTIDEAAAALEMSPATVERDWTVAKAWLYERLVARSTAR
jgi:RNA polymerase sigma factor (TIGR02999 family)